MEGPHDKDMDRDRSSSKSRHAPDLRMFEPIPPSNLLKIYKGCSNCRTQKIKCNGQEPCSRCRAFGLQCQYIVLPNQAAHRLAALAAAAAPSPSGAVPTPASAATSSSSTPSPAEASTPSSSTSPTSFSRTRTSKKKRRSSSVRKSPDYDNNAPLAVQEQLPHPDSPSTLTSAPALPNTPTSTQNPSGVLNVILHSMIAATDQKGLANMEPLGLDEPCPSPEVMRHLIENYLRYLHPMQCIVDEKTPDFWTRLERPMEPEVASIVYAMCTIGAMFMSVCGSGKLDDQVPKFYRRTCAAQEGRPHDIITIQTFLILHSFFTLTLQLEELAKSFQLAMDISEKIKLGEAVQKLRSKDRLSPGEVTVRNTWRLLIWVEIFRNMASPKNKRLEPLKDLTSRALDTRPEEVPTTQSSLTESMYFHTTNLFKVFQRVTRIKTPMSPRDVHAVNSTLDEFTGWHCSLPRHLRANSSRSQSTIGTGAISPYAFTLDLYYRVGHILLLNNLPYSIRSSPTGLGPRRESPLRILATSANSITATMGDLVKEPELRNYCLPHGVRSLTEAATIQQFNSKETDPAISTPAKINILKTLWCIRQFNFTVPTDVLNAVLEPFDTAAKASSSALRRDRKRTSLMMVDVSRPRTPSISAMSMESPTSSAPSHGGRGVSMASDYSSSAASTREGSHTTIYETDGIERDRPFRLQTSPSQDGAAASLLALSLESPTGTYRSGISPTDFSAEACANLPSLSKDVRKKAPCSDIPDSLASPVQPRHQYSREELYEGKRSRSSSVSVVSPKIEEVSTDLHAMLDIQPSSPLAQDSPSPSTTTHAHLSSLDDQEHKGLEAQNASHLTQFAPKPQAAMENLLARKSFDSIHRPDYEPRHRSLYRVAHRRSSGPSSQSERLSDFQENGMEDTMLFAKGQDELMPAATLEQDRSQTDGATILLSAEHPADDEDNVDFISASQQRPLSPLSSPRNDSRHGPKFSTGPVSNSGQQGDAVSKGSLQAGEDYQATTRVPHPDLFPLHEDRLAISSHADAPRKRQLVHQGDHELQQERIRRAGPEKLHLNTVVPSHPYCLDKKSPRTPLSASSDMGKLGYKTSPITSRSGSESDLSGLGAGARTKSQAAPVYHNHPSNPPSARSSISSMDISPHMPSRPSSRAGPLQSSALSRVGATEVTGSAGSVQEREHHLQPQQLPGHVQPHHLQYWSQHAGPLHEAEEDLERSIHQPTSVVVGRSGHDHDSRMTVAPTSSSSPIPAGFLSPLSPQSPRSTREQVRANSSRRSSSATWFESPVFSVGTNDEKVGMISAETTPVGLGRNAEQLEKDLPGSTTSHSSSVLAGRKRPSISMYGPSGMEDSTRPASGHEVSDGSNNRRHAMPLAFNADPLHQDGAEAARLRELRVHYLHHEEDLRRRYYHQDQQTMEEHAYVHAGAHAIQPMSRRHHPAPTRLSGRSVSPHQASPPPLHQRLQLRSSLHHDPHPPRDGRHEVESSYISSPTLPHAEDYLQGSYSYPQTPVQQHRPAPYYRQRDYQPQPGSDPQGRLMRQPMGRENMPPPEHHSGRHHPAYPSHPPQHPPHYQHYAYHPQPPPHSRQNPIPYPCEDDEAAGLSDVLRDPIRRKYY